jgi:DNA-binding NtrC family response regulator
VRELENVVERAVVLSDSPTLSSSSVELDHSVQDEIALSFQEQKRRLIENFEREYLEMLLARHRGNISHAAREAKKNRRALFELIRTHRIQVNQFTPAPDASPRTIPRFE